MFRRQDAVPDSGQSLHLSRTVEAVVLAKEIRDYWIEISDKGHASFKAKPCLLDDLMIGLELSCGLPARRRLTGR